jgi:hypothetical protein
MTTSQPAKTILIYTPYIGSRIPIFDGSNMVATAFNEISVATSDTTKNPAAIGINKVNDWFAWNDGGIMRLSHGPDWSGDLARSAGTALVMVNGILLNNVGITNGPAASRGTYVGTTRSNASSQLDYIFGAVAPGGSAAFFGIWNAYNRALVSSNVQDSNVNWTVGANTIASMDGSIANRVTFVSGLAEDAFRADFVGMTRGNVAGGFSGGAIGYDSTTAMAGSNYLSGSTVSVGAAASHATTALGTHFFQGLDVNFGTNAATNFGNGTLTGFLQNGMVFSGKM